MTEQNLPPDPAHVVDRDFTPVSTLLGSDGTDHGGHLLLYRDERPGMLRAAVTALRNWTARQWIVAFGATAAVGVLIGLSTVLIPNGVFGREIDSVAWNYPVWLAVSILSGLLFATYVQPSSDRSTSPMPSDPGRSDDVGRESRMGMVGVVLGWFAVGCPVCNKIALIALGYSGALRWFAPVQPLLAVVAIALSGVALLFRLRGQVWCPVPSDTDPTSVARPGVHPVGHPADR